MTNETKLEMFNRWYSSRGHWVYSTREVAMKVWQSRGIEGLPRFTGAV